MSTLMLMYRCTHVDLKIIQDFASERAGGSYGSIIKL